MPLRWCVVKLCMGGKEGGLRLARWSSGVLPRTGGRQERTSLESSVEWSVPRDSQVDMTRRWSDIWAWSL